MTGHLDWLKEPVRVREGKHMKRWEYYICMIVGIFGVVQIVSHRSVTSMVVGAAFLVAAMGASALAIRRHEP